MSTITEEDAEDVRVVSLLPGIQQMNEITVAGCSDSHDSRDNKL